MRHIGFAKQAGLGKRVMDVARAVSPEHRQIKKLRGAAGTKGGVKTELTPRLQSHLRRAGHAADKRLQKKLVTGGTVAAGATAGAAVTA